MFLKRGFEIDFEDGFQIYHSIPDLHFYTERNFPKNLLWDIDFREIDWDKNKRWVMARVFNRGARQKCRAHKDRKVKTAKKSRSLLLLLQKFLKQILKHHIHR